MIDFFVNNAWAAPAQQQPGFMSFVPLIILFVIFYFDNKTKKEKYNAMIEISKNLKDPSEIKELLEDFKEKKEPIDYRRSGVITLFVGLGLFLFGIFFIDIFPVTPSGKIQKYKPHCHQAHGHTSTKYGYFQLSHPSGMSPPSPL